MFEEKIKILINQFIEGIKVCDDPEIQSDLHYLYSELNDDDAYLILNKATSIVASYALMDSADDEAIIGCYKEFFSMILEHIPLMKRVYVIKSRIKGIGKYVYREIEIPAIFSMADLAYALLGSYHARTNYDYNIKYKNDFYFNYIEDDWLDEVDEDVLLAKDYSLGQLGLRKKSKMELYYGDDEEYTIDIYVSDIKNLDHIVGVNDLKVNDAKGYGIWEDQSELLINYWSNRQLFEQMVEDEDIEKEFLYLDEEAEFNLSDCQISFIDDYVSTKTRYEDHDSMEFDDDMMFDNDFSFDYSDDEWGDN